MSLVNGKKPNQVPENNLPSLDYLHDEEITAVIGFLSLWDMFAFEATGSRYKNLVRSYQRNLTKFVDISLPLNSDSDHSKLGKGLKRTVLKRFGPSLQLIEANSEVKELLVDSDKFVTSLAKACPNLLMFPSRINHGIKMYVEKTPSPTKLREIELVHSVRLVEFERMQDIFTAAKDLKKVSLILSDWQYLGGILEYLTDDTKPRLLQQLEHLTVSFRDVTDGFIQELQDFVRCFPKLRHLDIRWVLSPQLVTPAMAQMLKNFIKGVRFSTKLTMEVVPENNEVFDILGELIDDFEAQLYSYDEADISYGITKLTKLTHFSVENLNHVEFIAQLPAILPKTVTSLVLRRLEFDNCTELVVDFLNERGGQLEALHIEVDAEIISSTAISELIDTINEKCPNIKKLALWTHEVSCTESLTNFIESRGHQLERLELFGVKAAAPILRVIAKHCRRLKYLEAELYQPKELTSLKDIRDRFITMYKLHEAIIRVTKIKHGEGENVDTISREPNVHYMNQHIIHEI